MNCEKCGYPLFNTKKAEIVFGTERICYETARTYQCPRCNFEGLYFSNKEYGGLKNG